MLAPDTLLGPYRIVGAIGAGGMGEVYRAVDTRLEREVAVKVLSEHLSHDRDLLDDTAPTLPGTPTEPGRLLGTVGYMAPEQIRGGAGDHRSDIFAFGAMLYEMLTGRQPFRGDSPIETLNAILKDDPPDVAEVNPRIPMAIDRVVRHCLEKNPEERFQSARDIAFDLGALSGLTSQTFVRPTLRNLRWRDLVKPLASIGAALVIAAAAFFLGQQR